MEVFVKLQHVHKITALLAMASTKQAVVLNTHKIATHIDEAFADPKHGPGLTWKTLTSASKTQTEGLSSGIAVCAPGNSCLCVHQHVQTELYHILEGEGVVDIDDVHHPVEKGSVAHIPGNAKHGIRNTSLTNPLKWFFVFAADDFNDIKYRFVHDTDDEKDSKLTGARSKL